jgi:hypothetical protein
MLIIKDEFSRKLFPFNLKIKALMEVYLIIRDFKHWVKRQYGLLIYKLKYNRDKSVIIINGKS